MTSYLMSSAYIGGQWISDAEHHITVYNPATDEPIGQIPKLPISSIIQAIELSKASFQQWKGTPPHIRSRLLHALCDRMLEKQEELAKIITLENGKPIKEARGEVAYTASFIRWYAEEARRIYGETIPANSPSNRILVQREPIGVCALITPWNFPSAMLGRKVAAALAAGCSIIAKPAENTPFSALALAKLMQETGFPDGLLNIVTGEPDVIGKIFCAHPDIKKISFTGSTQVGRLLMEQSAPTIKKCSLELGGNAPFIVFADADLEEAIQGAMASKFRNCGQTCIASNRFLIDSKILKPFIDGLLQVVPLLTVGNGLEEKTDIGPMISLSAVDKIQALLQDAVSKGAIIHLGDIPDGTSKFVSPIIISNISPKMYIWHTEIFGPIIAISTFDTEEQALALANDSIHGLAAYVYTTCPSRIWEIPEALEYGMIGVNTGRISMAQAPFGGIKQSGIGREGGHHGLDEYLQMKYICQKL